MSSMYFIEPGYAEPTVVYKVVLEEVAKLDGYTIDQVNEYLDSINAGQVIVPNYSPQFIDRLKTKRFVHKLMRRIPKGQALNRQALATALRLIGNDELPPIGEMGKFDPIDKTYELLADTDAVKYHVQRVMNRNKLKAQLRRAFTDYYGGGE